MLWVALHLPRLPLVALTSAIGIEPAEVVAVVEGAPRSLILAPDRRAQKAGIVVGMNLASAKAILPSLKPLPRDLAAEAQVLHRVAMCACRFSSNVSLALPQCVLLEVSSSIRLFGGVRVLVKSLLQAVRQLGVSVWPAAAPSARGAWCLASTGRREFAANGAELALSLNALPVAALQSAQSQLASFETLGLRTLAALRSLDRAGLARRFSEPVLKELDQCYGEHPETLSRFEPPIQFTESITLPAPVADLSMLQFVFARMVGALCNFLHMRGLGVTRVVLDFRHEDVASTKLVVGLALTRSESHVLSVIRERLQHLVLPAVAESVAMRGEECAPLGSAQAALFPDSGTSFVLDDVMDRIYARLQKEQIYGLVIHPDHRPEAAFRKVAVGSNAANEPINAARPLWLLHSAKPIRSHPQAAGFSILAGPERIESGWWDGGFARRDYFVAQAKSGRRCWLYRTDAGEWFVHGLFA